MPPSRQVRRIELAEEVAQHLVVGAERALHERGAGEDDQADALAVQLIEQRVDEQLGARQAGRRHVVGEHAAREVEREHHLARAAS